MSKRCYHCDEEKPPTEFYRDKRATDGLKSECKACFGVMQTKWAQANPEKKRALEKRWRLAHPEEFKATLRRSQQKHKEKRYAEHVEWKRQNPERWNELMRAARWRYKARKRGAEGSHGVEDIRRIYKEQRGRCAICRCKLGKNYHTDHIFPLRLGGSNWASNIQLTCASCNHSKQGKDPIEFMQQRGLLL